MGSTSAENHGCDNTGAGVGRRDLIKRHLYLCYPISMYDRGTGMVLSKPSRFVDGIPRELLRPMKLIESYD